MRTDKLKYFFTQYNLGNPLLDDVLMTPDLDAFKRDRVMEVQSTGQKLW